MILVNQLIRAMKERSDSGTIEDFGVQWTTFLDNRGYYGSVDLLRDVFSDLIDVDDVKDCQVADVGSGTGRIVNMLIEAGAAKVIGLEPSDAFSVLEKNTVHHGERVQLLQAEGKDIPAGMQLDYVFCIGVLHHIPDPVPVVEAAFNSLRSGGRFCLWVYAREGNMAYILAFKCIHWLGILLPHPLLHLFVFLLYIPMFLYMQCCKLLPLPLAGYMRNVWSRLSPGKRRLVIYDQLNPSFVKFYSSRFIHDLFQNTNFKNVKLRHRHGYSWSIVAERP